MAFEIELPQKKVWDFYKELLKAPGHDGSLCWTFKDPAKEPEFIERTMFSNGTLIVIGENEGKEYSRLFIAVTEQEWKQIKEANKNGLPATSVLS